MQGRRTSGAVGLALVALAIALLHVAEGLPHEQGWRYAFWASVGLAVAAGLLALADWGRGGWLRRGAVALVALSVVLTVVRGSIANSQEAPLSKQVASAVSPQVLRTVPSASTTETALAEPRDAEESAADKPAKCGEERWPVKTLSDPSAGEVKTTPVDSTVDKLTNEQKPPTVGGTLPRTGAVERTVFRLKVKLFEARRVGETGGDRDIHLVVADPDSGRTMIVEMPDVACEGPDRSKFRDQMLRARAVFEEACGVPPVKFRALAGTAEITGVGFFDKPHGQHGRAPNAIELHPLLSFKSSDCARAG
jgi:hypothetical protein